MSLFESLEIKIKVIFGFVVRFFVLGCAIVSLVVLV